MKRYLCLFLALLMVAACFAGCKKGDGKKPVQSASEAAPAVSGSESKGGTNESAVVPPGDLSDEESVPTVAWHEQLPPATDLGGREFSIYERWFGYQVETIDFQGEVIWQESETGEMSNINLAKKQVLNAVENDYNCTITGEMSTDTAGEIRTYIQEDMLSSEPTIDFCFETYYYYYSFVEQGFLVDLNTLGIDFSKPWWDQNAVKDLSVYGKLYYALGDINTYDDDGTFVVLFNKALYDDTFGENSYKELYELAREGRWTFDVLKEKVQGFGRDSSGDGVRDELDTYGLLTETFNLYFHVLAAGEKTVGKNAKDELEFTLDSPRVYSALNDAVDLYLNANDVLVSDLDKYKQKFGDSNVYTETVTKAFKEGRGLFYMSGLIHLPFFRDMEDAYGILPVPKYDDSQDRYYHSMSPHNASCVFVPKTSRSAGEMGKQIGIVLDALGAYSKEYMTPEYYEKQLKRGDASDRESAEMLDIIFGNRTFDLGAVFGSLLQNPIEMCISLDHNLKSRIDSQKDLIEIEIEDMAEKIKAAPEA